MEKIIPTPHPFLHPLVLIPPTSTNPHVVYKLRSVASLQAMDGGEDGKASPFPFAGAGTSSVAGDGWEAVAPPATPPVWEESGRGWEVVADVSAGVGGGGSFDDCAIFPPSLHEGLHLHPDPNQDLTPRSLQEADGEPYSPRWSEVVEEEKEAVVERTFRLQRRLSDSARRILDSGMEVIQSKMPFCGGAGGVIAGGIWSLSVLAGLGIMMYMRRRDRRERDLLLLLLQEKDQRISQLLHQIALINEIKTMLPHQVSVLRKL
ncbi:uncharacterized protein [Typha angustifolia]|uniref:uncharacterized protein n=1 Tax=Typha angustifolia TaxID=59011 RepID=UPI003C2C3AB4